MQKAAIDHLLARGVATLLVNPFTPRNEPEGICANLNEKTFVQYATRGGNDAVAALKALKAMPDIDPNRVFLQGYSFGAISSLFATDPKTPSAHDAKIAGLIAYYPYCYDNVEFSSPTLVLRRQGRLDAGQTLPGGQGEAEFGNRRLSRGDPRVQCAFR